MLVVFADERFHSIYCRTSLYQTALMNLQLIGQKFNAPLSQAMLDWNVRYQPAAGNASLLSLMAVP